MYCKYCEKECKNKNSLAQHEIRCKSNPDKIEVKSNFIKYNEKLRNGEVEKIYKNHYDKAKKLGLEKPIMSEETKRKIGEASKNYVWTKERKESHSKIMSDVAKNNPESYSTNNVCGRSKRGKYIDSYNNEVVLHSGWEFLVAEYLDNNNIKWTNIIDEELLYFWEGNERRYYPDFYLPEYDKYIEVKGYERERDLKKWNIDDLNNRLILIKINEVNLIKENRYNIFNFLP